MFEPIFDKAMAKKRYYIFPKERDNLNAMRRDVSGVSRFEAWMYDYPRRWMINIPLAFLYLLMNAVAFGLIFSFGYVFLRIFGLI